MTITASLLCPSSVRSFSRFVTDLIGKPYQLGSRGPDAYDCFGVMQACYRWWGIDLTADNTVRTFRDSFIVIAKPSQVLDVVYRKGHVAVVENYRYCVTATPEQNVCRSQLYYEEEDAKAFYRHVDCN